MFRPTWMFINFWVTNLPCCSSHEDLSIDASITTVELILTKIGSLQHFRMSQIQFLPLKIVLGFPTFHAVVATREDHSIDVSFTAEGLILTKLGWFIFLGYRQKTDKQFWSPQMETFRHTKNFNLMPKIKS